MQIRYVQVKKWSTILYHSIFVRNPQVRCFLAFPFLSIRKNSSIMKGNSSSRVGFHIWFENDVTVERIICWIWGSCLQNWIRWASVERCFCQTILPACFEIFHFLAAVLLSGLNSLYSWDESSQLTALQLFTKKPRRVDGFEREWSEKGRSKIKWV